MADERPLYVQQRKGRWYWEPPLRLRRSHGLETKALGADTPQAWAYARALNRDLAGLDPAAAKAGTVDWLFAQFFASERFAGLAASTQRDYRWVAKLIGAVPIGPATFGSLSARVVRPRHADRLYAELQAKSGHAAAHYACRVARRVWKWSARREFVEATNPWAEMELRALPQRQQHWTPEQVEAVIAKAGEMGRPSIALAVRLAYWLGHRQGDVLALTWGALDAGERATSKTGARVVLAPAAYPELAAALVVERARQAALGQPCEWVLPAEDRRPLRKDAPPRAARRWTGITFTHEFRVVADAAGLPADLQFRDLRATAATELKDAGADVVDLSTHTGHRTVQMARRYARPSVQQFERAAEKRLLARNKAGPSDGTVDGATELAPGAIRQAIVKKR